MRRRTIEDLRSLLREPTRPRRETDARVWGEIEAKLGLRLPEDYKELVATFGVGGFDDFLSPFYPRCRLPALDLEHVVPRVLDGYRELLRTEALPYRFFPALGGLFPWAVTDNGDYCFWRTGSVTPNAWPVVVGASRSGDWFELDGNAVQFLHATLSGDVVCSVFPEDFPWELPAFHPVSEGDG